MFCSSCEKKSPFMVAFITAVLFLAAFMAGSWLATGDARIQTALLGALALWLIYFGLQVWFNKRIEAKEKTREK